MSTRPSHQLAPFTGNQGTCVFCRIIAGKASAHIHYQDDELVVIDNILGWTPVMLLVVPKRHMTQEELWTHPLMARAGKVAVEMGQKLCPGGYRILSNFGPDGLQTQPHGHLHVLGGAHLGPYA